MADTWNPAKRSSCTTDMVSATAKADGDTDRSHIYDDMVKDGGLPGLSGE